MTHHSEQRIKVLITSLPGMMQNVLIGSFSPRADVDLIGVASGGLSALNMIREQQPDLVVINSNVPMNETCALLMWLKDEFSQIRSLVLVETSQQLHKLEKVGADIAMSSYSLPGNLDTLLEKLKSSPDHPEIKGKNHAD